MHKANVAATVTLALLAALAWLYAGYLGYQNWSVQAVFIILPITLTACALFGWVVLVVTHVRGDDETRCRKCRHILRGLSQPRCPECGESI